MPTSVPKHIVPLKKIEYGFGYTIIKSPYTPSTIYLRATILHNHQKVIFSKVSAPSTCKESLQGLGFLCIGPPNTKKQLYTYIYICVYPFGPKDVWGLQWNPCSRYFAKNICDHDTPQLETSKDNPGSIVLATVRMTVTV